MTHTGIIEYQFSGTGSVNLRETDKYWVTECGFRFKKSDGEPANTERKYPFLHLDSVQTIE